MSYISALKTSVYKEYLSSSLYDHICGPQLEDAGVKYVPPDITDEFTPIKTQNVHKSKPTDVRLPSRINNPLIPYNVTIRKYIDSKCKDMDQSIHGHHQGQLTSLEYVIGRLQEHDQLPTGVIRYEMDALKAFARQKYSLREELINLASMAYAKRATQYDLSIAAKAPVPFAISPTISSSYMPFIVMIQRLRVHICKESTFPKFDPILPSSTNMEACYTMFDNGVYVYGMKSEGITFFLISCGGHFRIYHSHLGYWFAGPSSYLDYLFSIADIMNNLDILKGCDEYQWATEFFNLMIQFTETEGQHNRQVDFMKGMEGLLLNLSDYDEEFAMNWKPILEGAYELWLLDKSINLVEYDFGLVMALMRGQEFVYPENSHLCKLLHTCKTISRTHLQELSALHKLIFYAEVDAEAGVMKFLKRVHTPRNIDPHAVRNLTRLAKCQFLIAYRKKHNFLPNIIGPKEKTKLLEVYCQKGDYNTIETLNLSWWDDIKIFNCMDNTLTNDPLEFAKDKGAVKEKVSYGPGDSRKELLQVIEREDYTLKDFFASKKIVAKLQKVIRTNQKLTAVHIEDIVRLIEKEREQKIEARLFANGELSNKHALSLITTRMKKALGYFTEQLMTPTDKKRKSLIHQAARDLQQPDNYSLLLDIEGHNQSMQHANTSELTEFIGELFGEVGWGELGHYFSSIHIYHYDEYVDKVIVSEGQLGGIEGWLNPLWTLHTTLMLKLLRVMTDLDVKTIMVYSDDVNAILKIKQADEMMVQSVFNKIVRHCYAFGMTIKYSQTNLSKHRITMLRQHYADGVRADSTLKKLISISAGNNSMIMSEEIEVAGICSSSSSALELSNHNEACAYLKNYKIGLLLVRLPQMILARPSDNSIISQEHLPEKLASLLYYSKSDQQELDLRTNPALFQAAKNDIGAYLERNEGEMNTPLLESVLRSIYSESVAEYRLVDNPDRILYLQVYDNFLQDLLFFWCYLPTTIGGLGGALHLNLILSGHSVGFSKSIHYLYQWIINYSCNPSFFLKYLTHTLSIDSTKEINFDETRLLRSNWPNDMTVKSATTSVKQAIKSMVKKKTINRSVKKLFELESQAEVLAKTMICIFRDNFHTRIAQFYYENTAVHFVDLLLNKVETSSGLLTQVKKLTNLRNSLCNRTIQNIRTSATTTKTVYHVFTGAEDILEVLLNRKKQMFPAIRLIEVEEILYDDKVREVETSQAFLTIRRCSPSHYVNGIKVYDDPKVGNEALYKGELLDDDRLLGNKEELLAAKLVAVTKWMLMKHNLLAKGQEYIAGLDCVKACNLALETLTSQTFDQLFGYAPTETGGEILHRIPNMRFSSATYIRSEMNRSLNYTTDLNQSLITRLGMVDSNINFDYLRMRFLTCMIMRDKYDSLRRLVVRYGFSNHIGIVDVQFVEPKRTLCTLNPSLKSYATLFSHKFSAVRFRYLSHSYLFEENVNDWALIPSSAEQLTAEQVGEDYIEDIILRYARDLDRDYMMVIPEMVDYNLWKPIITKLSQIDKRWGSLSSEEALVGIRTRLQHVMTKRAIRTTVDKSQRVLLSLQTLYLEGVQVQRPIDGEFTLLAEKYGQIVMTRRHSHRLSHRLARYQAILNQYEAHKLQLAHSLILEYLITFHFITQTQGLEIRLDPYAMLEEFREAGLGTLSLMIINPDLQVRMMVLGIDYIERTIARDHERIRNRLSELAEDISLSDIIVPTSLPTLGEYSILNGREEIPPMLESARYEMDAIGYGAMSTLDQIAPLCRYAHVCSIAGAHPSVFHSFTGSDSLAAQYGLFGALKRAGIVDADTEICDLTAGRGDGLYAIRARGLRCKSFALPDVFTKLYHHPDIDLSQEYDVFKGSTLKFVTEFDFVHIDISFTGIHDANLLDLILFLEENSLKYSIRLNSAICSGYEMTTLSAHPTYHHSIAYAVDKLMKPYQVYLVGYPTTGVKDWDSNPLKQTVAFKSLALSYSNLLSPRNYLLKLHTYEPNSASIYLPSGNELQSYIKLITSRTLLKEQKYYCERFIAEIGADHHIYFIPELMSRLAQDYIQTSNLHMQSSPDGQKNKQCYTRSWKCE